MVDENRARIYSEVYGVISALSEYYVEKIPEKIFKFIYDNRLEGYYPEYDMSIPLSNQNISKGSVAFICLLHYNYWCKSEKERQKIGRILEYNEKKNREKYFRYEEDIFKKNQVVSDGIEVNDKTQEMENSVALTVKTDNGIFRRIVNFIKGIFRR